MNQFHNKVNQDLPTIKLRQGSPISLRKLEVDLGLSTDVLIYEFSALYKSASVAFGTKPFNLEFQSRNGLTLRADSQVGWLRSDSFTLEILPKFNNLDVAKVLSLALTSEVGSLHVGQGFLSAMSVETDDLSTMEMLALAFMDSLGDVINGGLQQVPLDVLSIASTRFGNLETDEWITRGGIPPIPVTETESSTNTLTNRLLKTALNKVFALNLTSGLQHQARRLEQQFDSVQVLDLTEIVSLAQLRDLTMPRADYDRSIGLALSIISGEVVNNLGSASESPEFLVNLDLLFEQLCFEHLARNLDPAVFEVSYQMEFDHDISPNISGKIIPDLVIHNKVSDAVVVVDAKNKISNSDSFATNADIFQLTYYAQTINARAALLIYPTTRPNWQFPVKSSSRKVEEYLETAQELVGEDSNLWHTVFPKSSPVRIGRYEIDLSGSHRNTDISFASLSFMIATLLNK